MNMVLNGPTDLKKLLTMKKIDTALSSSGPGQEVFIL